MNRKPLIAHPLISLNTDGRWGLRGQCCGECGAILTETTLACPACCARNSLTAIDLARAGKVISSTVVHRSFPGVETPFVSVIVALDDGGIVKGTLKHVPFDPQSSWPGTRVEVVVAPSQQQAGGEHFLAFHFQPLEL